MKGDAHLHVCLFNGGEIHLRVSPELVVRAPELAGLLQIADVFLQVDDAVGVPTTLIPLHDRRFWLRRSHFPVSAAFDFGSRPDAEEAPPRVFLGADGPVGQSIVFFRPA